MTHLLKTILKLQLPFTTYNLLAKVRLLFQANQFPLRLVAHVLVVVKAKNPSQPRLAVSYLLPRIVMWLVTWIESFMAWKLCSSSLPSADPISIGMVSKLHLPLTLQG